MGGRDGGRVHLPKTVKYGRTAVFAAADRGYWHGCEYRDPALEFAAPESILGVRPYGMRRNEHDAA
jgi:hypothetical protein